MTWEQRAKSRGSLHESGQGVLHPPRQTVWAPDFWVPREPSGGHVPSQSCHSASLRLLLPGQLPPPPPHLSIPKCLGKSLSPVSRSRPVWGMEESKGTRAGQAVGCHFKAQGKSQVHHLAGNVGAFVTYPAPPGYPLSVSPSTSHMGTTGHRPFPVVFSLCQSRLDVGPASFH